MTRSLFERHAREGGYTFVKTPLFPGFSFMIEPGESDIGLHQAFVLFLEACVELEKFPVAQHPREIIAQALYAQWSEDGGGLPDWPAWQEDLELNPVGLRKHDFFEDADLLLEIFPAPYTTKGPVMCEECGKYPADLPSKICPGCEAYQDHQR